MKKLFLFLAFSLLFSTAISAETLKEENSSAEETVQAAENPTDAKTKKALKKQKRLEKKAAKEAAKENKYLLKQNQKEQKKQDEAEEEAKTKEEETLNEEALKKENPEQFVEGIKINQKTGFPEITQRPYVMFNEGVAYALVTRLEKMENRSNFVWQNHMIGAYFEVQTENMRPVNSIVRVSAFYPFYHTFDGMRQYPKQTILYAADIFAGPMLQTDMWKYVRLNFAFGPHYMYQLTDEYHMNYLGAGLLAGVELPVARYWTILSNGIFTLDYANLGTNRNIQPFDYSWQYHVELGVRYSKRNSNRYAYIRKRS